MKPVRTYNCNIVYKLEGGDEGSDLPAYKEKDDRGNSVVCTVWMPTNEERVQIARGENIRVVMWGDTVRPMDVQITDEPLGKRPDPTLANMCAAGGCTDYVACASEGICLASIKTNDE